MSQYCLLGTKAEQGTVWRLQDFSVIQILREINFGKSRSTESAIFAILEALNFVNLVNYSLQMVQKLQKSKFRVCKCVKMPDFAFLTSHKFISRKI